MTSKKAFDLIATNCVMNCKKPLNEKCSENCEILKAFKIVGQELLAFEILKDIISIKFNTRTTRGGYLIKVDTIKQSINSDNLKWVQEVIENDK